MHQAYMALLPFAHKDFFMHYHLNRRQAMLSVGAAAGMAAMTRTAQAATRSSRKHAALAARLPIRDPAFNVHTLGRLEGDLSGKVVYLHRQGRVFGLRPGHGPELDDYGRLLYKAEGVSVRTSRLREDGAIVDKSRNWLFYRDPVTGEFLSEFTNPYTGETVPVPTFRAGITGGVSTTNGPELAADFPMESTVFNQPMLLDWNFMGDHAWIYRHAFTRWREGATSSYRTEMTLDCWVCRLDDVANPRLTHIPSTYSWTSQTEWQSWLRMKDEPGAMLWRHDGVLVRSIAELPQDFVEQCEKVLPGHLSAPLER